MIGGRKQDLRIADVRRTEDVRRAKWDMALKIIGPIIGAVIGGIIGWLLHR